MKPAILHECQRTEEKIVTRLYRPYPLLLLAQFWKERRTFGFWPAARHAGRFLQSRACRFAGRKPPTAPTPDRSPSDEILNLQPGELVEIKTPEEILATLDPRGAQRGLYFVPEMWRYCGRRLRVYKRLETIFLEESKQLRRLKHTVLLEGAVCEGAGLGCDKSCLLYWREAWLKRAGNPSPPQLSRTDSQ